MSVEPIRVELEAFCQQFTRALEPFSDSLDQSADNLREAADSQSLQTALGDLQDNRHRLKILLDKARQQNTYLVIFGPLKSGKSTLMNAISGAYVSEVSSLPAYPCLVYVKEGNETGFSTTAFNGDKTEYDSREALHGSLEAAHEALARRLRESEAEGNPFNPAQDFTEAVRRIDFSTPAPYLRKSGTILVDTPGLYTKMKYSYGQLTRDFRDTAACAVFVVKTDNLFFEQVFEEFADLLEVFSRVFLVVNIDSSKQDLGPDGTLQPSLEQQNPERIVEAFENLTVNAQIRSAIDSGRLRIYMVDLLQTAMRSLQSGFGQTDEAVDGEGLDDEAKDPAEAPSASPTESAVAAPEAESPSGEIAESAPETQIKAPGPRLGFESFLQDLTEYLNSSGYIIEFMADSLRQARSILTEVSACAQMDEIAEFREGIATLEQQANSAKGLLETLVHLKKQQWEGPLEELGQEIRQQLNEHAMAALPDLEKTLHQQIEDWTETDESVHALLEHRILEALQNSCEHSRSRAIELFDGACGARNGGIRLSDGVKGYLQALELSFDDIYATFQPLVRERFEAKPEFTEVSDLQDALPIRRRWIDWLLFRSESRVRRHVLGPENPSEREVPANIKAKRIDEEATAEFCAAVSDYARRNYLENLQGALDHLLREYSDTFQSEARARLDTRDSNVREDYDRARSQLELRKRVLDAFDALVDAAESLDGKVDELRTRFVAGKRTIDPEVDASDARAEESANDEEEPQN